MTNRSRAGRCAGSRYPFLTLKERDIETGLDYFLARYYASVQGRFTSPDEFTGGPDELYYFVDDAANNPTFYADLRKPQSLNKYQYAYNNPLRYIDPDGHDPEEPEPPQDPRPVVPLPPIPGAPPLVVPGGPTTSTAKPPNDATIIEGAQRALDTVADVTGISKLADLIRPYCPFCPQPAPAPTTETPPTQNQQPLPPPAPMQTTEEKKKNLADAQKKGIPGSQLGPSGKPKVHTVNHPTKKRAEDAARAAGQGKPAKDTRPKKGGPHFHPTNKDGTRKKGKQNVHHEYPN